MFVGLEVWQRIRHYLAVAQFTPRVVNSGASSAKGSAGKNMLSYQSRLLFIVLGQSQVGSQCVRVPVAENNIALVTFYVIKIYVIKIQ